MGSIVPAIKVSSNSAMANRKQNWIDVNAGAILDGANIDELTDELYDMVLKTAEGAYITKSEHSGYKEIGIFRNGVTL